VARRSVFERSDFTNRFLYGWPDCSGPYERSAGKRATLSTTKTVLGFVTEVTARDERNREIPIEAQCSEEM
jgi:hypothetical protein